MVSLARMRSLVVLASLLPLVALAGDKPLVPLTRGEQVLVAYAGAVRAPAAVTRTKEEARRRAAEVSARALKGEAFGALVAACSDEPGAAARGGSLGTFTSGVLVPELEQALAALAPGDLAPAPVETPFGFHVVHRLADVPRMELRMLVVTWRGAPRAGPKNKRTRAEARAVIDDLVLQLGAGAVFEELAQAHSDDPSAARGGALGALRPGVLLPELETAALALGPGQVSSVVETPLGFHLLQRVR